MSTLVVDVLDRLVMPISISIFALLVGLGVSVWRKREGLLIAASGLLFLWVLSTTWVGNSLLHSFEEEFPPQETTEVSEAGAIVVLSGVVWPSTPPLVYPDLGEGADRVWHAARLQKAGVAPRIIVTGGALSGMEKEEAPAMRDFLLDLGVPSDSVLIESESKSTRGNAVRAAELCEREGIERVVLVTSAFHMPRALSVFRNTDLRVIPAATDYRTYGHSFTVLSVLPQEAGLQASTKAVREYVATLYYWLNGWL